MMNLDWISVSERLPKDRKEYLITDGKSYAVGYWRNDVKVWENEKSDMGTVSHWADFKRLPKEFEVYPTVTYKICPVCGNKMFKNESVCDICNVKFNFD